MRLARCAATLTMGARQLEWRGPDPYDGLYWRWPRPFVATPLLRQVITQLHARSPFDIRVLRRQPRPRLAKTLALFTQAALLAAEALGSQELRQVGSEAARALDEDRAAAPDAWGYPFPVQTRWSTYPADSPNVVVTSFGIEALLLAGERLNEPSFTRRANDAGDWLATRLMTPRGHFAYHEHSDALIHNANLLGAAAVYRCTRNPGLVRPAVELSLLAQRPDGSWPYGEGPGLAFVDSFHTAYVLRSLNALRELDPAINDAVTRGARYWRETFFDEHARATLWPHRRFPEDGHSAGTALSTLSALAQRDADAASLLEKVAARALSSMVEGRRAVHRRYRWGRARVRYLRWCDGHLALGMAAGALALADSTG